LRFAVGRQIDINCIKLQAGVYAIQRLSNRWAVEVNPQLDISRSHFITVPDTNDQAFQQVLSSSRLTNTDIFEGKISNTSNTNGDLVLISRLNNGNTLYRLAIPVTLKYRMSQGLHLTGGICTQYLIGQDLRKSNIYQEDLVQHSKYYQQRNLNFSLLAGLQYNFKKYGLDINYSRLILLPNLEKITYSASGPARVVSWTHDPLQEITVGIRMRM
ncbi:MAG TPA: outer membrane beta-barrel protein, partial [Saprospiraceae bacterium]|nr:outer membrane beta-barrel protein [Saprospiraceae bacterium]